jgi:hypothetical protein
MRRISVQIAAASRGFWRVGSIREHGQPVKLLRAALRYWAVVTSHACSKRWVRILGQYAVMSYFPDPHPGASSWQPGWSTAIPTAAATSGPHRHLGRWGGRAGLHPHFRRRCRTGRYRMRSADGRLLDLQYRQWSGGSINGIVAELEARIGRTLEVHRQPGRPFDLPISVLHATLARTVLGWSPRMSFREGMARTLRDLEGRAAISMLE